jgi:hypothetical protein
VALDTATEFVSFTDGAPDIGAAEFAIVGAPAHGQLDVADATPLSSATLTYPPDPGYVGSDSLIYGVRDAMGILVMNAVSFALPEAAYFNLDAAGTKTWLDWAIGIAGEIFVDQKTMAVSSPTRRRGHSAGPQFCAHWG